MPNSNSPVMQRRHLNLVAELIRNLGCLNEFQRRNVAIEFAESLRATNSRFNRDRFIEAATATGRVDPPTYVPPLAPPAPTTPPPPLCGFCEREPATHMHRNLEGGLTPACLNDAGPSYMGCCSPIV